MIMVVQIGMTAKLMRHSTGITGIVETLYLWRHFVLRDIMRIINVFPLD